jgi:hypothetical protein
MLKLLKLPSEGEDITIKILESPISDPRRLHRDFGERVIKCCIYGKESELYYLELRPFIFKEILKTCKNNNIPIDEDLKCSIGRIFTIFGKRWTDANKRMWHMDETTNKLEAPMIHILKLKKDL